MLKELGKYKDNLSSILLGDEYILRFLLEDTSGKSDEAIAIEAKKYIHPHLYMEPAEAEPACYIFLETAVTKTTSTMKTMKIVIQPVCHKDILTVQNSSAGYYGTRYDLLAERIEELLYPSDKALLRQRQKGLLKRVDFSSSRAKQLVHAYKSQNQLLQNSVASTIYAQIIQQNVTQKIAALETYLNT